MKVLKYITLLSLIIFINSCSTSSFNPFSSNKIYYIEGEDIGERYNPSTKIKRTKYTSAARHKATMKPYCVAGKYYKPTYVQVGDSMRGIASWYGPNFHGKQTSNGEYYNMYDMTVAHKTWPMDTMVRVTNLDNGKSVIARVNDRGPFVAGRIVDCSYAVGKKIGIDKKGTCNVRLDVVGFAGKVYKASSKEAKQKIRLTNFGVQVGAFAIASNAKALKVKYEKIICSPQKVVIKDRVHPNKGKLYHVLVMGFSSRDEAQDFINKEGVPGAFIIRE